MAPCSNKLCFLTSLVINILIIVIYYWRNDFISDSEKTAQFISYQLAFSPQSNQSTLLGSNASFDVFMTTKPSTTILADIKSTKDKTSKLADSIGLGTVNRIDNGTHKGEGLNKSDVRMFTESTFQMIDSRQEWIYSAYFDHVADERGMPAVRVMGVIAVKWFGSVFCHFRFENGTISITTGNISRTNDNHNRKYQFSFATCKLKKNQRPLDVSITFNSTSKPTNRVLVTYPGPRLRNMTVCYSVLHSNYSKFQQLVESIEMNTILGAGHFVVYNYSIAPSVDEILRHYQKLGIITVIRWSFPTNECHYYGQEVALNDCLFRNRNSSSYIVVVDTDEFIIPRNHFTWLEVINTSSPKADCFILRTSFFYTPEPGDVVKQETNRINASFTKLEMENIDKCHFLTLSQFTRESKIYGPRSKTKWMGTAESIDIAGVHFPLKLTNPGKCVDVAPTVELVHHYRKLRSKRPTFINDTSALKFRHQLYARVLEVCKLFPHLFH